MLLVLVCATGLSCRRSVGENSGEGRQPKVLRILGRILHVNSLLTQVLQQCDAWREESGRKRGREEGEKGDGEEEEEMREGKERRGIKKGQREEKKEGKGRRERKVEAQSGWKRKRIKG